ncbi:MAG: HD domain-containing protein [Coriobacteriia bacterium]|nr:HD domain-containing protein [Coriobacteriia bacterium]MCL2750470.1 HD domain-containing protein [Coriobacteriia bacterium]
MELDARVNIALDILMQRGFEAFVVGGCVRDSLMGGAPKDWDVCTDARPEEVGACFVDYPVYSTGLRHGTITVVVDQLPIEVTTYRHEGEYVNNRQPKEVYFVRSLDEDLARRDFTINALAFSPGSGFVDPFKGAVDIQNKIIRCVGNPAERFSEDGLRIMRALRFASRLGFSLAEETAESLRACKELLLNISAERLAHELTGMLTGEYVHDVLIDYVDVLGVFIPEIMDMVGIQQNTPYHQYDVWEHTVKSVAAIRADKVLRLAMLFHDSGKPATRTTGNDGRDHFYGHERMSEEIAQTALKRLKYDNETIQAVVELIAVHDKPIKLTRVTKWLNRLGEQRFEQLLEVKVADMTAQSSMSKLGKEAQLKALRQEYERILEEQKCFKLRDLAVNGRDLIALGIEPGVFLGEVLGELLEKVMDEQLANDKQSLLAAATDINQKREL